MARQGLWSIAVLLAAAPWLSSQGAAITVYRCTAADGTVSLQDAPCAAGQTEERRTLRKPVDAPAAAVAVIPPEPRLTDAPPRDQPPPPREPVTPLYDCYTHDGTRYESDTGIGQRRWVPLWVLGLDPVAPRRTFVRTGATPSAPRDAPRAPSRVPGPEALGAGAWVQDECWLLSPQEACARRREALLDRRRERKDAQANARVRLQAEAETLEAQLARECG